MFTIIILPLSVYICMYVCVCVCLCRCVVREEFAIKQISGNSQKFVEVKAKCLSQRKRKYIK